MTVKERGSDSDHLSWLAQLEDFSWDNKNILDIGCGSGFLSKTASESGAKTSIGIDLCEPEGLNGNENWAFQAINLEEKKWYSSLANKTPEGFDYIFAFDIIEHISSPWDLMENCFNLLKPNGSLIITTPNTNSWERFINPAGWSGSIDPQHKILFNSYSLRFLLEKIGFSIEQVRAPLRSLGKLNALVPNLGGQLFCQAKKK